MLAMVVNDDVGGLTPPQRLRFFREQARSYNEWEIAGSSLNSNVRDHCNTAEATFSRTVVLPPSIVYNRGVFYAILASDPLCRITVTVNSPQFFRLECP